MDHDYCAKAVSNILESQLRQEQHGKMDRLVERTKELNAERDQRRKKKPIKFDCKQHQSMIQDFVRTGRRNQRKHNERARVQYFDKENVNLIKIAASSFMTRTMLSAFKVPNGATDVSSSVPTPSKKIQTEAVNGQLERYYRHLTALDFMDLFVSDF